MVSVVLKAVYNLSMRLRDVAIEPRLKLEGRSAMDKIKNVKLQVTKTTNPYRPTSFKFHIFKACLAKGEFTRAEFREMVLTLKQELEVTSKMKDEVLWKAWLNEFVGKSKDIEVVIE